MFNYDKWLLDGAEKHLAELNEQPRKVSDLGIEADDKQALYKWAVRVYDEYEPSELVGEVDWTGEIIQADDLCTYLNVEDNYVPKFPELIQEALIEIYGEDEQHAI